MATQKASVGMYTLSLQIILFVYIFGTAILKSSFNFIHLFYTFYCSFFSALIIVINYPARMRKGVK